MNENSQGDLTIIDAIDDHIQKHVGDIAIVFHEKVSADIHVHLFHVAPSRQRPFHTLITCGMSEKAMTIPEGWEDGRFAELMIRLPESWPVNMTAFNNEEYFWPVRLLKALTRYPHENDTWLFAGHSVRCSKPPRPFAPSTKMTLVLVCYPRTISEDATIIHASDDRQIWLWAAIPLFKEEWELKNRCGFEAFNELLNENEITELLNPKRTNVALE